MAPTQSDPPVPGASDLVVEDLTAPPPQPPVEVWDTEAGPCSLPTVGGPGTAAPPTPATGPRAETRRRVCIIGAGAAGMAAAWSLGRFPERYAVTVYERAGVAGGVATSEAVGGAGLVINDGVQGGAKSYRNTLLLHALFGFHGSPVHMRVSFGKGATAWNNYNDSSPLVHRLRGEIKWFGQVLRWIHRLEVVFIFVPICWVLTVCRFSADFSNLMVYALTALFFGTGNQTKWVSSAVVARVFLDPDLRLFDYDDRLFLSQTPEMFGFQKLGDIYQTMVAHIPATFHFHRPVHSVVRHPAGVTVRDPAGNTEAFDDVVFACDAETVLRVLQQPSRRERWCLGNVRYYDDVTVTHEDEAYMQKYYDVDPKRGDQYYVYTHPHDPSAIDMSFNLSNYQPHLRDCSRNVYQTIFLDKARQQHWSMDEIRADKVLLVKWWRQFAHTWRHFAFTVPLVRFMQGQQRTWYCGAYTLFNTHEIATISGLAVAARLGAPYPFRDDPLAAKQFDLYLKFSHGVAPPKTG
eukprot:EG_transcript_6685